MSISAIILVIEVIAELEPEIPIHFKDQDHKTRKLIRIKYVITSLIIGRKLETREVWQFYFILFFWCDQ